ncbi:MAG: DUF4336 domain-containing protein [Alphaproteobacteria bacterium]|nr:DUF4336 domain-containing protein [Alphaproteobacteria bacterium]
MPAALQSFGSEIWVADGPTVVGAAGFHFPTRMAVIRLEGGGLFVWSPIALSDGLRAEVEALGAVRHLIAPNGLHHVFIGDWMRAFPDAKAHAAPGLAAKRKDIAFASELGAAPAEWGAEIDQAVLTTAITTEVVFFHRPSATAIFTDLLQQLPKGWYSGWRAIVAKLDLMTAAEPSVPRKFRMAFGNKRSARAALAPVLAWPAEKVLMAHGAPVTSGGQALIARAFRWLTG